MTAPPLKTPCTPDPAARDAGSCRDDAVGRAGDVLDRHGGEAPSWSETAELEGRQRDGLATRLMDLFRRTGSGEAFEALVGLVRESLLRRVRLRSRQLGADLDPEELLQDTLINVYRYPDRFEASWPGAFRAWSSTIVDNAIRRHLRRRRAGPDVSLSPVEILAQQPDGPQGQPGVRVMQREAFANTLAAFQLLLRFYLSAFLTLSDRERFVLQMVEVRGMRYARLAAIMGCRPEALKMVVFRARKRIAERMGEMMPEGEAWAMAG